MRTSAWVRCQPFLLVIAVAALGVSPSRAAAQEPVLDWAEQHADAGYLADVGTGLTIAGISTVAVGTGLFLALRPSGDSDSIGFGSVLGMIGGGVLWGVGGLLVLAGVPTWIVGAVRASVAGADSEIRAQVASDWETAGMAVFWAALGVAAVGAGLFAGGVASQDRDLMGAGLLIPIGVFAAAFIGAPMWAEGARF